MTKNPRWITALMVAAVPVLVAGSIAWVFPREITAVAGPWALPALSLASLLIALGLAIEWRVLGCLILVLAVTLVLGWNRLSTTSTSHFAGACLGFLVMFAVGRAVSTPRRLRFAVLAFLGGGMVVLVLGLVGSSAKMGQPVDSTLVAQMPAMQLGLAGLDQSGKVNPNALAAAVLLIVPLGVSLLMLRTGQKIDWLTLLSMGFVVVVTGAMTLVICRSRSAWIVIWLILVGALVRGPRSWLSRIAAGALVIAPLFVAIGSMLFLSQETFQRSATDSWISVHTRVPILTQGVERWKESPWLGIGLNEFRSVYKRHATEAIDMDIAHAHNIFLQTALDVGFVGSAAYWGALACLWLRARQAASGQLRLGRSVAVGSALSLVAISLFGLFDAVPLGSKIGVFQWMASGLILAACRMQSVEASLRHESPS